MAENTSKEAVAKKQPAKKRRKWPYILGPIAVLVIIVLALLGVLPGTGGARDLGVKYDHEDYDRALAKSKLKLDNKPSEATPDTKMTYSGQIPINKTFTNAEITALLNFDHSPRWPVSDVQVRFNSDGSAEASGIVTYNGMSIPVYVKGKGNIVTEKSIGLSLDDIKVGNFPIPQNLKERGLSMVTAAVNDKIDSIAGLELESFKISSGKAQFTGTIPESAVRVKTN